MIKDFQTYINEGLFDRSQSEFSIKKTDKGIEQIYIPKTKDELCEYIKLDIEQSKKEGTYPNVNLNNIDVSKLGNDELKGLFSDVYKQINPDISNWNIKYIPNNFFNSNKQIKEFTIPDSVTSIEEAAFYYCSNLTSVTIPNSVTNIGDWVFSYCNRLTAVEIPDSATNIGDGAFYGCGRLTSVVIPNSVTYIGTATFSYCSSLTSVTIPNSVTSIGIEAFDGCVSLTSVTISNNCNTVIDSFPENCKIIRRDD